MNLKYGTSDIINAVIKEFEKKAIQNGESRITIEEAAEKVNLQKKAAIKNDFSPGVDLFEDLMKLAGGLRSRGFIEQADDLEKNIINYKIAETHLYKVHDTDAKDLIDFAHPEGDVAVADPVKDNHHMVETIYSQRDKILNVVNKQPTGKYASKIKSILKKAKNILIKNSQTTLSEQLAEINNKIEIAWQSMKNMRDNLITSINLNGVWAHNGLPIYSFTEEWVLANDENAKVYSRYSGVDIGKIKYYANLSSRIYLNSQRTPQGILRLLLNSNDKNYYYWKNVTKEISPEISNKYFTGTQPEFAIRYYVDNDLAIENPDSIWIGALFYGIKADQEKAFEAATVIHNELEKKKNEIFGARLEAANKVIQSIISGFIDNINTNTKILNDEPPTVTFNTNSVRNFIYTAITLSNFFKSLNSSKNKQASEAYYIISIFNPNALKDIQNDILLIQEEASSIAEEVSTNTPGMAGEVIQPEIASEFAQKLINISKAWVDFARSNPDYADLAYENATSAENFANYILQASGKPFGFLYTAIKDVFNNINTIGDLEKKITSWENATNQYTGYLNQESNDENKTASLIKNKIIKKAQLAELKLPPKSLQKSPTAPQQTNTTQQKQNTTNQQQPKKRPVGTGRVSEEERHAVMRMQKLLEVLGKKIILGRKDGKMIFGNMLNKDDPKYTKLFSIIQNTGARLGAYNIDGWWGPNTAKSLNAVNTLLKEIGLEERVNPGPFLGTGNKAVIEAMNNSQILRSVIYKLEIDNNLPDELKNEIAIIDKLPEDPKLIYTGEKGNIPLLSSNINGLREFYEFIKNNYELKNNELDYGVLRSFITAFKLRAAKLANKNYLDALNKIERQFEKFSDFLQRHVDDVLKISDATLYQYIIQHENNNSASQNTNQQQIANNTRNNQYDEDYTDQDLESSRKYTTNKTPFGSLLNLNVLASIADLDIDNENIFPELSKLGNRILSFKIMDNNIARRLATQFIPETSPVSGIHTTDTYTSKMTMVRFKNLLLEIRFLINKARAEFAKNNEDLPNLERQLNNAFLWGNTIQRLIEQIKV